MIKKITVLYTDGTYDDIGDDYFKALDKINYKNLENSDLENQSLKENKKYEVNLLNEEKMEIASLKPGEKPAYIKEAIIIVVCLFGLMGR